ncbi:hypothetical protein Z043_116118 [Scleropages formosus]|uniref:Coiled-coil domain-containing protein 32 n=1 Tax=Scleropages formosus TaxID=113540 RepID=A0A0N8JY39_SCLFO|nr:hypothetical protein Z043_116118 [Scleropages formosus]
MVDDLEPCEIRSSSELWSEICSELPNQQPECDEMEEFMDSFQPQTQETNGTSAPLHPWAPLADSAVYIATLENRLRRIKGLTQEVTSQDMLRTLSQAKKECWDRFLHDVPGSDSFYDSTDIDQSAFEQLKRWLQPEKVAINTEELEYLLFPGHREEGQSEEGLHAGTDKELEDKDERVGN